jgi:sec-independent protein translocase protein TatA
MIVLAMFGLGVPELLIILAVVLLLFGGSRLAGLGKSTGRALKEFKEETKGLKAGEKPAPGENPYESPGGSTVAPPQTGTPYGQSPPQASAPYEQVPPQNGTPYGQSPSTGGYGPSSNSPYGQPQDGTPGSSEHDVRRDG